MEKKTRRRRTTFLSKIMKLAFIVFTIYALATLVSVQLTNSQKKQQLAELEIKGQELEEENSEYQDIIDNENEKEYLERIAREKYGYGYPNEIKFYDTSRN